MKISRIFSCVLVSVILAIFSACGDDDNDEVEVYKDRIFSYTPPCKWKNIKMNQVYVVNSNEDITNYLSCVLEDSHLNDLNFENNTLLVAVGTHLNGIVKKKWKLIKRSETDYLLRLEMTMTDRPVVDGSNDWSVALKTPKLPQNAKVALEVNYSNIKK